MRMILALGIVVMALVSCQGTPRYGGGLHTSDEGDRKAAPQAAATVGKYAVDPIAMGAVIDRYIGRPYAGTSDSLAGFDCSDFVLQVYYEYAEIHLPRTTQSLFTAGREVKAGDLYFGDLVFFDTGGRGVSHVGIYVGFDEFAHASSTAGVTISSLNDKYYGKRYIGARRVME